MSNSESTSLVPRMEDTEFSSTNTAQSTAVMPVSDQDPDTLYVVIIDDFDYSSARQDNVIFYDYSAQWEAGWDYYQLDSLDELSQLDGEYFPGFGAWKVADDNGSESYETFINFEDQSLATDWTVDKIDDDPLYDYYWWSHNAATDSWVQHFTNDADGIDELPTLAEADARGMQIVHYERYEDFDGEVDFYDDFDVDDYYKVDTDPDWDYAFYYQAEDVDPVTGTESYAYMSPAEIEQSLIDGTLTDTDSHGDAVLDSFQNQLRYEYGDDVTFILIDAWDDDSWNVKYLFDHSNEIYEDLYTRFGIAQSDIDMISMSFSTDHELGFANLNNLAGSGATTVLHALPNHGKHANRFWDVYLESQIQVSTNIVHVSGLVEDVNNDGVISGYESRLEGFPSGLPYSEISTSTYNATFGWNGNSFATPTVAAGFANLKLDLDTLGIDNRTLTDDQALMLLKDAQDELNYSTFHELDATEVQSVFATVSEALSIDASLYNYALGLGGGFADDHIVGSDFNDNIDGAAGSDWIEAGLGDDAVTFGLGMDYVSAGGGNDNILLADHVGVFSASFSAWNISSENQIGTNIKYNLAGKQRLDVVIDGEEGYDTLQLSSNSDAFFLHDAFSGINQQLSLATDAFGRESHQRFTSLENIDAGAGDDLIDLTSPDYSLAGLTMDINAGVGNDIILGSDASGTINAGDGNDVIYSGAGNDLLSGGNGTDTFQFTATSGADRITDFDIATGDVIAFYTRSGFNSDASDLSLIDNLLTWNTGDGDRVVTIELENGLGIHTYDDLLASVQFVEIV